MLRHRIDVSEAVSTPRGKLVWSTPKSHASRSVPFPNFLTTSIVKRCEGRKRDDLVFVGPDGGVMRSGNFRRRQFATAVATCRESDAEFPELSIHDLRHTAASLAISAGANVKAVQRMLGHASAAMTLDVYADLFDDDLESVATALDVRAGRCGCGQSVGKGMTPRLDVQSRENKTPGLPGVLLVAPTGIDPVTFRFSVERSTN